MGRIGPESKKVTKYHRMDTENDITTLIYDCRKACINCFNDIILYELIENEGDLADCDWCGSKDIKTIPIHMLSEMFRDSAKCYDEVTGPDAYMRGKNISECFQEDWDLFSSKIEGNPAFIQEMTLAILVADTRQKERFDLPDYSGFFNLEMPELEFEWFEKLEKSSKKKRALIRRNTRITITFQTELKLQLRKMPILLTPKSLYTGPEFIKVENVKKGFHYLKWERHPPIKLELAVQTRKMSPFFI